jgi:Xaa-Pro aminopeptidase
MSRKDSEELLHLRKAVQITDEVFCDVLKLIRPGATEQDLAAEISYRQRRAGAEGDAFDIIVASGPRSALPHARATPRKVRNGELVLLDFGCVVEGYHSDMTRTVAVGRVSSAVREAYQIVLQAQEMGIGALEKGRTGREIDLLVRSQISHHGLRRHFPHSTGHGVGLRIHESPWLGPRSKDILEAGNVVAVEPGIYLPGIGGIRIEDVVLVTEKGRRVLTAAPKELMVL